MNICYLLTKSFSCLWVANTWSTCSNQQAWPSEEVLNRLWRPPSMDLSHIAWTQKEFIKRLAENACGSHGTKATSNIVTSVGPESNLDLFQCKQPSSSDNVRDNPDGPSCLLRFYLFGFRIFSLYSIKKYSKECNPLLFTCSVYIKFLDQFPPGSSVIKSDPRRRIKELHFDLEQSTQILEYAPW